MVTNASKLKIPSAAADVARRTRQGADENRRDDTLKLLCAALLVMIMWRISTMPMPMMKMMMTKMMIMTSLIMILMMFTA